MRRNDLQPFLHSAARQRGNAAIEFVLILLPLLLLLFAIVSYASYFLLQQRVNHTVGDVARIVSLQRFTTVDHSDPDQPTRLLNTDSYQDLIADRLAEDGWLSRFSQACESEAGGLCHTVTVARLSEGCEWLAGVSAHHQCVEVNLDVDVEGWILTDLLRHVGRAFSDTANWVPKYASASAVVRLQNNR